ncbi:MAG TPA: hypothetical protein VG797_07805 [Phycisphaerales bacterium]|nr:hypothetical protein [Phycisphaerales bacterium]
MTSPIGAPPPDNPFAILGLAPSFDLSTETIRRAWLRRSSTLHPDRTGSGAAAAGGSHETASESAKLNDARRILDNAERRADALLNLLGGPRKEQEKSLPDGFLQDILGTRMEIEEAIRDKGASGAAERAKWDDWARNERRRFTEEVSSMFRGAGPAPDETTRRAIRTKLNAWRYIERLIEQLDPEYDPSRADFNP